MEALYIPSSNGNHSEESELERALRRHERLYLPLIIDVLDGLYNIEDDRNSLEHMERLQVIDLEAFSDYNLGLFLPAAKEMKGINRNSGRPGFTHPLSVVAWLPYLLGREHPRLEASSRVAGIHDLVEDVGGNTPFERGTLAKALEIQKSGDSPRERLKTKNKFYKRELLPKFPGYREELMAAAIMVGAPHLNTERGSKSAERKVAKTYQIVKYSSNIPRSEDPEIKGEDLLVAGIADGLDVLLEDKDLEEVNPSVRDYELERRAARALYTLNNLSPHLGDEYAEFVDKAEALFELALQVNSIDESGIIGHYEELERAESYNVYREADIYVATLVPDVAHPPSPRWASRKQGNMGKDIPKNSAKNI